MSIATFFLQLSQPSKSNMRNRLLSGGFWVISGQGISMIVGIAISAFLTRMLSPDNMGAYFLTLSMVSTAAVVGQFGLSQTSTKLVAESMGLKNPARTKFAIIFSLKLGTLVSVLVALTLFLGVGKWLAYRWQSDAMHTVIIPASIFVIVLSIRSIVGETFRGFHDIRLATIFSGLASNSLLAVFLLIIWVLRFNISFEQIIILSLIIACITLAISLWLLAKRVKSLEITGENNLSGSKILSNSWPLLVTSLSFFIITQADLWILGAYSSQENVALYGAVLRLVTKIALPLLLVSAIVPPIISEMYAQNKQDELEKLLRSMTAIAGWPAFFVLLFVIFYSRPILENVYGDFYGKGARIFMVLSIGQIVNVWSGPSGLVLIMTGYQKTAMYISLFSGLVMVIGVFVVVNRFGLLEVAIISSLSVTLRNFLMVFYAHHKTGIWTHMAIIPDWRFIFQRANHKR